MNGLSSVPFGQFFIIATTHQSTILELAGEVMQTMFVQNGNDIIDFEKFMSIPHQHVDTGELQRIWSSCIDQSSPIYSMVPKCNAEAKPIRHFALMVHTDPTDAQTLEPVELVLEYTSSCVFVKVFRFSCSANGPVQELVGRYKLIGLVREPCVKEHNK